MLIRLRRMRRDGFRSAAYNQRRLQTDPYGGLHIEGEMGVDFHSAEYTSGTGQKCHCT